MYLPKDQTGVELTRVTRPYNEANGKLKPDVGAIIAAGADAALKLGIGLAGVAAKAAVGAVADAAFPVSLGLAGAAARAVIDVAANVGLAAGAALTEAVSGPALEVATGVANFAAETAGAVVDGTFQTVTDLTGAALGAFGAVANATFLKPLPV